MLKKVASILSVFTFVLGVQFFVGGYKASALATQSFTTPGNYGQWDAEWNLDENYDTRWLDDEPFNYTGCVPTSIANALVGFGIDVTPIDVAKVLTDKDLFNVQYEGANGDGIKEGIEHYGLTATPIDNDDYDKALSNPADVLDHDYDNFVTHLQAGEPIIIIVDNLPFTEKGSWHALLAYGYENGKTNIVDPWNYINGAPSTIGKHNGQYDTHLVFDVKGTDKEQAVGELGHAWYAIEG